LLLKNPVAFVSWQLAIFHQDPVVLRRRIAAVLPFHAFYYIEIEKVRNNFPTALCTQCATLMIFWRVRQWEWF